MTIDKIQPDSIRGRFEQHAELPTVEQKPIKDQSVYSLNNLPTASVCLRGKKSEYSYPILSFIMEHVLLRIL